jgi:hypothetical protein
VRAFAPASLAGELARRIYPTGKTSNHPMMLKSGPIGLLIAKMKKAATVLVAAWRFICEFCCEG